MNYANKDNIEHLIFKSDLPNTQISKATGIIPTAIGKYTRGESAIGNMSLDNAIKLQNYYNKLEGENKLTGKMSREESFGRAFAILNIVSERRFNNGGRGVEAQYLPVFSDKPMTTYFRAHKHVMEHVDKFTEVDFELLSRINNYIGVMGANDYNDEQLDPVVLLYISKESVELRELIKNKQLLKKEEEQ